MEKEILVDLFDGNHKLLKMDIPVENILKEFENFGKDKYYVREKQEDGSVVECSYVKRDTIFEKIAI